MTPLFHLAKCTPGSPGFLLCFVFHPMEEKESFVAMGLNVCLQMTDLAKHLYLPYFRQVSYWALPWVKCSPIPP